MKRTRRRTLFAIIVASATMLVACSNVSSTSTPTGGGGSGGPPDNSGTTINIAVSPWLGSEANVAVAKQLLEQKLGYTVKTTNIDEYAQFPALSNGDLDATLEVWPSGHAKDYTKYIQANNGVVDGGVTGVTGQIGWWIPTYMLTAHPELATWEGLKTDAALFKTAESGSAGQILDGDPSYVTYDQSIADNLGLNLKVVYGGSESAEIAALDAAYQKQAPILMYFWTPHWAQQKYDLTMIKLPDVTPACTAAAANDATKYACAYPQDNLYKAFNSGLQAKAPAAFAFLSAMQYTNADQNGIALDLYNKMSDQAAAQ